MKDSIRWLGTAINNYVRFQARDEEYTECMRCGRIQFNPGGCLQCERDARAAQVGGEESLSGYAWANEQAKKRELWCEFHMIGVDWRCRSCGLRASSVTDRVPAKRECSFKRGEK